MTIRPITVIAVSALLLAGCGAAAKATAVTAPGAAAAAVAETQVPTTVGPKAVNAKVAADTAAVYATVTNTLTTMGEAIKNPSQTAIDALAQSAQSAHDTLVNLRSQMALDNVPVGVEVATNDLKNSMGALVAYTGTPNSATLASFNSQWTAAQGEWNAAVTAVYANHAGSAPTIGV